MRRASVFPWAVGAVPKATHWAGDSSFPEPSMHLIAPPPPDRSTARRLARAAALAGLGVIVVPAAVGAQFGPVEALAGRVSDLSFYFGTGGLTGTSSLEPNAFGVRAFGVELLFEVAQVPSTEARRRHAAAATVTREVLDRIEVRHLDGRTDTTYHYAVRHIAPEYAPDDIVWTMEVGIGYGQVEGFRLRDPDIELNTTVRNLPAVTMYLTYEPAGTFLGLRTGFMRTDALQAVDSDGNVFRGRAEAFLMGALVGLAVPLPPAYLFLEGGFTLRSFPSVEWTTAPAPLAPGIPRHLDVSGWNVAVGIQFPVR